MPLQQGFPPSNLLSAGVRIAEKDLSFISAEQTAHRAGLVGFASKGPINTPTLVTSSRQLHTIFGYPHPDVGDPYLLYAGDQYLTVGSELFVVRVGDTSPVSATGAATATYVVPTAGGPVQIVGNIAVGAGGWSFAQNTFFRWRLNGVLASNVLVILSNANRPSPDTGTAYTAADLVNTLNDQLSFAYDGIQFYFTNADANGNATASSKLGVQTTFAYGSDASMELVSVVNALFGPSSVVGMGTLMTAASLTGTATQYPTSSVSTPGVFNFSGLTAGSLNLQVVVDGTNNVLIDNVVQTVSISSTSQTMAALAVAINNQIALGTIPGGFTASAPYNVLTLTSTHQGRDSKIFVKPTSTTDLLLGLDNDTHVGTSPSCVTVAGATYSCGIVTGSANSGGTTCFTLLADSPGIDGNNTQIVITNHTSDGDFTIDVYVNTGQVYVQVESWGNLTKDQTSTFYVESYLAQVSSYIRALDNTATGALPAANTVSTPYSLTGGSDGIPADPDTQDALLIGTIQGMTGLQAISDPEQVDIDLVAIPGHTSTAVVGALLDFCQNTRRDCFAIIDSPFGLTVREIVQWQNGTHPLNSTRFDSDFGALYWPWLKLRDGFNHVDVWTPPSGSVMAAYAGSDQLSAPWFPPAGTTRGLMPNVIDVFSRPSLTDRDQMYGNRNAINPIIQFPDLGGFTIWGQKTLQRRPTALDRVNVRRMMLYIEKVIKADCRNLLFEPNDEQLWSRFIILASKTLNVVQLGRGIHDYKVKCDADTNPPDVVDRNELRARIGVQPTRAAEFIFIEFSIHRTGSFSENADTL